MIAKIRNSSDYQTACRQTTGIRLLANILNALYPLIRRFPGKCECCHKWRFFSLDRLYALPNRTINFRERMICPKCALNNRMRATFAAIESVVAAHSSGRALILEAVTPFFSHVEKMMTAHHWSLLGTEFWGPQYAGGEYVHGIRHEDASRLSFPNGWFDMIISNEVFEHIPDPDAAFRDMFRTLAPGGVAVFTVPMDPNRENSLQRAKVVNGEILHLTTPEIHGNPVDGNGSLAFWTYGWDILDHLRTAGFDDVYAIPSSNLFFGNVQPYPHLIFFAEKASRSNF